MAESIVDEMVRRGVLPKPVKLSAGRVRWSWTAVACALASLGGAIQDADRLWRGGAKHATKARQRGAVELPKGKAWGGLPITGVRPAHVLAVMNGLASTPGKARNFLAATKQLLGVGNHARPHRQQQFVLGPLRPGAREDPGVGWCNLHGLRCMAVIRLCLRSAISWACLWRPCNATSASLTARKAAELLS
jgi:hypothetical protein